MGILDALRGLTRPYDEDEDFFDDEEELMDEEEVRAPGKPAASKSASNPFFDSDTPEYDSEPEQQPSAPVSRPAFMPRRNRDQDSKPSRMGAAAPGGNKIVFMKPDRYEDTKAIYDHLRNRRIVLMSLDDTNKEIARRILDFMAGAAYATDGKIARVSSGTYIITPKNVDMMGSDMMEELENSGLFF